MPTIPIDGGVLNYRIDGDPKAPPLVFSNSLGTALAMWDWQVPDFAKRYRVIRYDQRGHGGSTATPGFYKMETLGRDVIALLDALGIESAYYCGLSMGGMTGMWLGANAPKRFKKLVLSNTSARMPQDVWKARIETALGPGMTALVDSVAERWFSKEFRAKDPAAVNKVRAMILATSGQGYAGCCGAIRDMDHRGILKDIPLPTLVIVGSRDPATPPADGQLVHEGIRGSRLVTLEAAHLSNIEQAAWFTKAVLDFLAA
ncbi:MAG TPA: 3-oxoadipate enol-lactonase [Alphaproteobacteria bacterium]|nr:3-oxoadipate enol-lactonase [Alphaproteobacteria bacterium]